MNKLNVFFVLMIICLASCKKPQDIPTLPRIEFKSFSRHDTGNKIDSLKLTITFEDGDGDIGLGQGDTVGVFSKNEIFYNNLYVIPLEKVNGHYPEAVLQTINGYRTPVLTPEGRNKSLKGEIAINISAFPPQKTNDTIKYQVTLYDRALHKSNVIETPEIVISTQ